MTEEPLIDSQSNVRVLDLSSLRAPLQLPRDLADLRDRLCRHGFSEACEPARRIDWDAPAERRVAVADQPLGLAFLAKADVLVPVQLQGGREVVHLGEVEVFGSETGLLVRRGRDGISER